MRNPTPPLFRGPLLKVERAKQHIEDLAAIIAGEVAGDLYEYSPEATADERHVNWAIRTRQDILDTLPLQIGDAVHNLRSALDLLACDLVQLNNGNISDVYFPFAKDAQGLQTAIKKRHVDRAAPDVVERIVGLKPYAEGGDVLLRAIHDLDIIDKHCLLIPTAQLAEIPHLTLRGEHVSTTFQNLPRGPLTDDEAILAITVPMNASIKGKIRATLHVTFPIGQPLGGEEAVPKLREAAEHIGRIIEGFRAHCVSK